MEWVRNSGELLFPVNQGMAKNIVDGVKKATYILQKIVRKSWILSPVVHF
jgi:hypothetical protein